MKEYTDADVAISIQGAEDLLESAKRVVMTIDGRRSVITKDCDVDGCIASIHLSPQDTMQIGSGSRRLDAGKWQNSRRSTVGMMAE